MTPVRSLLIASIAVTALAGARPLAGDDQFPRGLMSAEPRGNTGSVCTIQTRPMAFGTYDPLADTAVDAVAQIIYYCSESDTGGGGGGRGRGGPGTRAQDKGIRIEMDMGTGNSNENRELLSSTFQDHLAYNIYLDPTHRTVWGDGSRGTNVYLNATPPLGTPVIVLAYGRIFRGQDAQPGQYADVVGVRIQF